jgi:hypothetical protein
MMEFLANRQGEVEPFQLQIVCRHAEQQVAVRQGQQDGEIQVDDTVLGGRKAMETLLEDFYLHSIRQLPSWSQRSKARALCELGLLSPNGHRVSIEQGQIHEQYKVSNLSLEKLAQTRLIRKETRPGLEGFYYELSHDSVARAVSRSRRYRVPTIVKIGGIAILLGLGLFAGWQWQQAQEAERQAEEAKQRAEVTSSVSQSSIGELIKLGGLHEPDMVNIQQGSFRMGIIRGPAASSAQPVRQVMILPFAIGRYEVTFEQYDQFAFATRRSLPGDAGFGRGRHPVINVSWQDAKDYAEWLSRQTGKALSTPHGGRMGICGAKRWEG